MSRSRIREFIASKVVVVITIPLIIFVLYQLVIVIKKAFTTDRDIGALQKQVGELEKRQKRLQEFNEFLGSDFFAEKEARLKLGMQKKGEQVVVVPSRHISDTDATSDPASPQGDSNQKQNTQNRTSPQEWWVYFFGV